MALQIGEPLTKSNETRLNLFYDHWRKKKLIHTASLQACKLLAELCADMRGTVIDLGCGFPSVVLREFNPNDCRVVSVYLSEVRADKVKRFLDPSVRDDGLYMPWVEFKKTTFMDAILIFFNISDSTKRVNYFPAVFEKYLSHKGVYFLFNDMHKPALFKGLQEALKGYSYDSFDTLEQTEDEHGRYCQLIEGA